MHVGLVIYSSLETISGGYLYDRKLVQFLEKQGDQVDIVSLPWRSYPLHLIDNLSNSMLERLVHLPLDLLLEDELNHPSLVWLNRRLKQLVEYPVISIVHHLRCSEARPRWQNQFYQGIERAYLQTCDGLIFNSQTTRQSVERVLGRDIVDATRTGYLHSCGRAGLGVVALPAGDHIMSSISSKQVRKRAESHGPLRLLFLGNVIKRKGLHDLLDALAILPRGVFHLDVAGNLEVERKYAECMKRKVVKLGLEKVVKFWGSCPSDELADLLADAQVLTLPSSYEGYGIVFLEGMSFGLPALACAHSGAEEVIMHGVDGFLVSPGDSWEIALDLAILQSDRSYLTRMSLAALERYNRQPSWEQTTQLIRNYLVSVIEHG